MKTFALSAIVGLSSAVMLKSPELLEELPEELPAHPVREIVAATAAAFDEDTNDVFSLEEQVTLGVATCWLAGV